MTIPRPTLTRTSLTPVVAESVEQPITKADFEEALRKTQSSVLARNPLRAALVSLHDRTGVVQVGKENIRQFEKWKSEFGSQ